MTPKNADPRPSDEKSAPEPRDGRLDEASLDAVAGGVRATLAPAPRKDQELPPETGGGCGTC